MVQSLSDHRGGDGAAVLVTLLMGSVISTYFAVSAGPRAPQR